MGCEQYEPHLTAYLDNELTDEARSMIERHLAECASCRDALAELEAASSVMRQWKSAEVGDDFLRNMRERLRQEKRRARRNPIDPPAEVRMPRLSKTVVTVDAPEVSASRWKWAKVALAASILVGAVGLALVIRPGRSVPVEPSMSAQAARNMVKSAQTSSNLSQIAVATDVFVAAEARRDRARFAGVVGAETVQMFLESPSGPAQGRYVEILLGSQGKSVLATTWSARTGEAFAREMNAWTRSGLCYAQDVPQGYAEMTTRTETALSEGLKLERLGKYEEAITAYAEVRGSRHERTVALVRRAGLLIKLGRFKEAQDSLTEAARGRFEDALMGQIAARLTKRVEIAGEVAPRIKDLKQALAARPANVKGWRELADLELGWGNYLGASEALTGLAGQLQGDARDMARFRAAWCAKNAGEYEKALAEIDNLRANEATTGELRELCLFESADILYRCARYSQSIDMHRTLIGYPGVTDDAGRGLLILRVGFIQLYDLTDKAAAKETLTRLTEKRYATTPAGHVAQEMLLEL